MDYIMNIHGTGWDFIGNIICKWSVYLEELSKDPGDPQKPQDHLLNGQPPVKEPRRQFILGWEYFSPDINLYLHEHVGITNFTCCYFHPSVERHLTSIYQRLLTGLVEGTPSNPRAIVCHVLRWSPGHKLSTKKNMLFRSNNGFVQKRSIPPNMSNFDRRNEYT
jgi:hypothetical protein